MDEKEVFNSKYFILNKIMLKCVSLWPYQKLWVKMVIRIFIFIIIYSMMIPQAIRGVEELHEDDMKIDIIIESFAGFLLFNTIIVRLSFAARAGKQYQEIFDEMAVNFKEINDEDEKAALHYYAVAGRTTIYVYTAAVFGGFFACAVIPVFAPIAINVILPPNKTLDKSACYTGEFFVDQNAYAYHIMFFFLFTGFFAACLMSSYDCGFIMIIFHALGLTQIIHVRLMKARDIIANPALYNSEYFGNNVHKFVRSSILMHMKVISFIGKIQDIYNVYFLFMGLMVLIGASSFSTALALKIHEPVTFTNYLVLWINTCLCIFITIYVAQQLIDSSHNIYESIYFCGWYSFRSKTISLIKFMLLRSRKPIMITAGNLFALNFPNFGLLLKVTLSYFTFLISTL